MGLLEPGRTVILWALLKRNIILHCGHVVFNVSYRLSAETHDDMNQL